MRKLISICLLLWLPLVSGNALAQAMLMSWDSMTQISCPEHADQNMPTDCAQCEFCQMACSACLPTTPINVATNQLPSAEFAPFSGKLRTLILPLLDPPPISA